MIVNSNENGKIVILFRIIGFIKRYFKIKSQKYPFVN